MDFLDGQAFQAKMDKVLRNSFSSKSVVFQIQPIMEETKPVVRENQDVRKWWKSLSIAFLEHLDNRNFNQNLNYYEMPQAFSSTSVKISIEIFMEKINLRN